MYLHKKKLLRLVLYAQGAWLLRAKISEVQAWLHRSGAALCMLVCAALGAQAVSAADCDGAQRIRLRAPVELSAQERAELRALPPLRIVAVSAPPMMQYDADSGTYIGISADVLCFLAQQTGLRYEFITEPKWTADEKIRQVQAGQVDVFVPLSRSPEREHMGIFTAPYYESHYAVIARKARRLTLSSSADLAKHHVGFVRGVALEPILSRIVPITQLHRFETSVDELGLFDALRNDVIDVAVFNRDFFSEKRYVHELFDLEIIHSLNEFPRHYGFYFSRTPQHQRVVAVLDRYLAVMDTSAAMGVHEVGERQLMDRYMAQRSQRTLLLVASVVAALLALMSYVAMRKYRKLSQRLTISHEQVLAQQQALQTANEELERLSQTDGLTRLANRRQFDRSLAREHVRHLRKGAPLSLLMIDVDHFKHVNDHYGHPMGDDYLRAVARALERSVARATDLVARYGGEEFACLLPDTDFESACAVAELIRASVAHLDLPNVRADIPYMTVSIGVATLQGGEHSAKVLVASADHQLYTAKQTGRNRVCGTLLQRPVMAL